MIKCTVLIGPTAVGKSRFVYDNFSSAPIHLISADSMQIYRGFDVATATPAGKELEQLEHTGINEIDPDKSFDVSSFLEMADEACEQAIGQGNHPLILGGTALYVRAFLYGLDEMPDKNPGYRQKMEYLAEEHSSDYLHERLREVDPTAAENIHPNDQRRIIRALEIYHETGQTKTELKSDNTIRENLEPTILGLSRPREELERRIRSRIDRMISDGLISEVEQLKKRWGVSKTLKQAIGFQSVSDYLDGRIEKDALREQMVKRTRNLMKKQQSWFKRFPVERWYHPENDKKELIAEVGNQFD